MAGTGQSVFRSVSSGFSPAGIWVITVNPADQPRSEMLPAPGPKRGLNLASPGLVVTSAVLLVAVLVANLQSPRIALALLISLVPAVLVFALFAEVIRQFHRTEWQAKTVFEDPEQEFHYMANNIQEVTVRENQNVRLSRPDLCAILFNARNACKGAASFDASEAGGYESSVLS